MSVDSLPFPPLLRDASMSHVGGGCTRSSRLCRQRSPCLRCTWGVGRAMVSGFAAASPWPRGSTQREGEQNCCSLLNTNTPGSEDRLGGWQKDTPNEAASQGIIRPSNLKTRLERTPPPHQTQCVKQKNRSKLCVFAEMAGNFGGAGRNRTDA